MTTTEHPAERHRRGLRRLGDRTIPYRQIAVRSGQGHARRAGRPAGPRGARRRARHDPPAQGHLRRVQRAQGVADQGRPGRRVAAVPRRLGRARRRGRRHRPPRRATRAASRARTTCRMHRNWAPRARSRCATASRARRWCGAGRITDDRRRAAAGQGRTLARRRRRLLLAVRAGHPGVESARQLLDRTRRRLRDHHDSPCAVPDSDRRVMRQADLRGRLARLAPGAPAREGVGARATNC